MIKIEDTPLFINLDKKFHKELYESIYIKNFSKNSIVFYEGDSSEYLHILLNGEVRLYKTSPKDTMVQINRLTAPATIGEYACLKQIPFPITCEIISTNGTIGLLHYKNVMNYMQDSHFSMALLKSMTDKVIMLYSLVHKETILSSEAKVADLILNEIEIFEKVKNNEIASILNITPETLSRILGRMKKENIIIIKNHTIKILNIEALHIILEKNTIKACSDCLKKKKTKKATWSPLQMEVTH
ncbi:Crp/Fnr family transcriptional regulator [Sulfurovum sp. bin170]|uniref:Crp/Fnr family transcriptional regulator n=1 Tax=Sulfurovum sp. bin170 TaxID=2695268 RepID=UPI0013DEF47B|nr:Crp/Fnr family transcriptional regulator [Sulfurovum sp. bin170]NEW60671.1 Crp/Fnr family transcriptional regulator [Sulfurovum sp. bin170]